MPDDRQRWPLRKQLPHDVPIWIDAASEVYFITINCSERGVNRLCHEHVASFLFDAIAFRNRTREWFCRLCLLMPDHLHALISFTNRSKSICQTIADWKRWTAVKLQVEWQANFFEHRVRNEHEEVAKTHYILQNPVRKGMVEHWQEWPFVWRPTAHDDQ